MIGKLVETFKITMEMDDIIDFSSYKTGIKILKKYKIKFETFSLNHLELLEYQPNRYPFLMIDYVTKVKPGKLAEGYKNFTNNEWFFPIHFPGAPNVPGALQLEAMAQMLTVAITTLPGNKGKVTHAISHKVSFKKEIFLVKN